MNNDRKCIVTASCSGYHHQIINSLHKDGYEEELQAALKSAKPLSMKRLSTCIAIGGPEIMLQSQNSRYISTYMYIFVEAVC